MKVEWLPRPGAQTTDPNIELAGMTILVVYRHVATQPKVEFEARTIKPTFKRFIGGVGYCTRRETG